MVPDRHPERAARLAALTDDDGADPILERAVLAHRAWLATELGTPDADTCAAFARRALDGDLLLGEAGSRAGFHCCVRALIFTDHFAEAEAAITAMREDHAVRGSLRLQAGAAWYAAELAQRTGRIADAENEARLALDLTPDDVNLFTGGAIEILVWALAERGAFAEAHALLDEHGLADDIGGQIWEIGILHSRAVLALAEGDFPRAHDQAVHAGRLRIAQGRPNPVWTPWRATAALALAHQGRQSEAAALAAEELALAERFGAPDRDPDRLARRSRRRGRRRPATGALRDRACPRRHAGLGARALAHPARARSCPHAAGAPRGSAPLAAAGTGRRGSHRRDAAGRASAPRVGRHRSATAASSDRGRGVTHPPAAAGV